MIKYIYIIFTIVYILFSVPLDLNAQFDLQLDLDPNINFQTMDNFGTSSAFELNEITDDWDRENLEPLAERLFSTDFNPDGTLRGIGLSNFRVEIGACSYDQENQAQISRNTARSKCPLRPDGTYDWSQMEAELYWAEKAHEYNIHSLIAYSNSPPIYYTKNGLACRTSDVPSANLREDAYDEYAEYLAQVAAHFESVNTPLDYISPVNEPQWEWLCSTQEGSQWRTDEIRDIVVEMQSAFTAHQVSTKATITEAGSIDWIYNNWNNNALTGQLRFWDSSDPLYIGDLSVLAPVIAGHSYWTEDSDERLYTIRRDLAAAIGQTDIEINWWQTEYSFLGEGYQDLSANPSSHELGLFMAKVIHTDLTVGNASAWQFWETFESGSGLPRYRLIRINRNQQTITTLEKTYWALGHYSRFIRPGMRRIHVERSDNLSTLETLRDIMPTAFINPVNGDITIVLVNYLTSNQSIQIQIPNVAGNIVVTPYLSTETLDMVPQNSFTLETPFNLPARSLATLTLNSSLTLPINRQDTASRNLFQIQQIGPHQFMKLNGEASNKNSLVTIRNTKGQIVFQQRVNPDITTPLHLKTGIYFLHLSGSKETQRLLIH